MRDRMSRQVNNVTYRFRPELPPAHFAHIEIAKAAPRTFFAAGKPLNIVVWNTFKGKRERYYHALAEHTAQADLILLQEFAHDPALEANHRELFAERDASMAISFYTQPNQAVPTGVCTVASAQARTTKLLLSRYLEPVTRTPKTAICSYYPVACDDCPPKNSLLVLNSHGINFRLRRPFRDQMQQFEEHLTEHEGPIILVGDFNTWERGRVRILDTVTHRLGLMHVQFPAGIKMVGGHELDRVYVRGGTVKNQQVILNKAASDHSMLAFQYTIS